MDDNKDTCKDRRQFLKNAGTIIGAGALFTVIPGIFTGCEHNEDPIMGSGPETVDLSKYPSLASAGGSSKILFEGKNDNFPVIVIRNDNDEFLTVTSKCTHQGCEAGLPREFYPDNPHIVCGCHGSTFSEIDGSVIAKPDGVTNLSPLQRFTNLYEKEKNTLTIYF